MPKKYSHFSKKQAGRGIAKLTAKAIEQIKKAGKYFDGHGLYFYVTAQGARYWRSSYRFNGKAKTAAHEIYPQISLKEAREANAALRAQLAQGIDPLAKRKAEKAESQATDAALFSVLTAEWYEQTAKAKNWGERHCKKISQ